MKCSFCGGSNFKEYLGDYICKDCGTRNKKETTTTTTTTTTAKPMSTTTSVAGVCAICGGKDFKEYMGKKICKNCGSPLAPTTTTTSTTTTTPKPTTTTAKPMSTTTSSSSVGVCAICGGKDFKEYLGKQICKNCGSPLAPTATKTTTTTAKPTTTPKPTTSKPKPATKTVSSTTTTKPLSTPTTKPESVSTPPVSYKYDFSIVFKPSVKLFGFESFTKDKKIADEIQNYLLSKKYRVSEGYGESSDTEIYSKAIIVVGTKAEYIDSKINEKLNSYKRDSERYGKSIVYYVYDKSIPNGLPIDVSNTESFDSNGDDFLEMLSKRFIEESGKY